ncbi:MAG: helix-turn-helix transcriptional regulator [Bauldia sp.]|nr:helix-turn-helix transcriptional regulator [Bauldia sp.]
MRPTQPRSASATSLDAADDAVDRDAVRRFREALAAGVEELIPSEVADRLIGWESPVRVLREYRGLSTTQLAAAAGLSQPYIVQIEGGARTGTTEYLAKIAAALGVAVDDLI